MSCQTQTTNLSTFRGDTFSRTLTIKENGVAKNITGWTITVTIKKDPSLLDNAAGVLQYSSNIHTTPASGITSFSFSAAQMATLDEGVYYYDCQLSLSPQKQTILYGKLTVTADITLL